MLIHFEVPVLNKANGIRYSQSSRVRTMPVDILETSGSTVIFAELPGTQKDQVQLTFEEGILTIGADRTNEDQSGKRYVLRENTSTRRERRIVIDHEVDASKIAASLSDGLLRVELPKAEKALPRTIEVR